MLRKTPLLQKSYSPLLMHNIYVLSFHCRCPGLFTLHTENLNHYRRTNIFKLLLGTFAGKSWCLSPGCYNKMPQIGWLKQQEFIFHILKAEKSESKVPTDLVPGDDSLPGLQRDTSLLCPNMVERGIISPASSCKDTNPILEGSTLTT